MEDPDLVPQKTDHSQSLTHSRPNECGSRQVQVGPDHPHRMVSPSRCLSLIMQLVAPASNRPICHKVQQKVSSVCDTSTGPLTWAVDALILPWEDLDTYAFPPVAMLAKVVEKLQGLPMQENH